MADMTGVEPLKRTFTDFTEAATGLRSLRAILLLILAVPLALLIGLAFLALAGFLLGLLGVAGANAISVLIMSLVVLGPSLLVASSPAGVVLMDVARGFPERGMGDALLTGLVAGFKVLVSILFAGLLVLIWVVAVAAALYLCKLPILGSFLFVVLVPVATVGSGLAAVGFVLSFALVPPAIWEGLGITEAIIQFYRIIQKRTLEAFIRIPILYAKVLALIAGVTLILLVGNTIVGLLSEGILHIGLGIIRQAICGITGAFGSGGVDQSLCQPESGAAGLFLAKSIGSVLLLVIANCGIGAIFLMALNLLYLDLSEGLGSSASIVADEQIQTAKAVAGEVQDRLKKAIHGAQVVAEDASTRFKQRLHEAEKRAQDRGRQRGVPGQARSGPVCPQCGSPVSSSDAFCGGCGARLELPKLAEEGEA